MIDHIGIKVTDLQRSVAFYTQALAPLGYAALKTYDMAAGFGEKGTPDFWISTGGAPGAPGNQVCFLTSSRAVVRAFHAAALAAGGTDNGAPGVRADYHPNYYGAFVLDPDGHNIEAVCHEAYLG